jgi:hypothetical protein
MSWIIASVPFWFVGVVAFLIGVYGMGRVAFHEGQDQAFKSASDVEVLKMSFGMILIGGAFLIAAAKIAS